MHFLRNLLTYMLPVGLWIDDEQTVLPPGFAYVINHQNKFVMTSSGDNVIAKS